MVLAPHFKSRRGKIAMRLVILFSTCFLCWHAQNILAADEAANWAQPIKIEGLPNFHKVNDNLYRGAQPLQEGYLELKKLGVKTIVGFRDSDTDSKHLRKLPIKVVHIPMKTGSPTKEDVVKFLKTVSDPKNQPVFVHCKHGSDRTGLMCACYRIFIDKWTKTQAIDEMTNGDFGFHPQWSSLIDFIQDLNVEEIEKKAGITE